MCESCYEEVHSEGRGVYCPSCFQEAELLQSDSISSSDHDEDDDDSSNNNFSGSDDNDEEQRWNLGRRRLTNANQANLHLLASRAGTKLSNPNLCATSAVEIAQAFGTGTGTMFLIVSDITVKPPFCRCNEMKRTATRIRITRNTAGSIDVPIPHTSYAGLPHDNGIQTISAKEAPAAQCLQPYVIDVMSSWNLPATQLTHGCVDDGESRPAPHV